MPKAQSSVVAKVRPTAHDRWIASNEEANPETKETIRTLVNGIHESVSKACRKSEELLEMAKDISQIEELNRLFSALLNPGQGRPQRGPHETFDSTPSAESGSYFC